MSRRTIRVNLVLTNRPPGGLSPNQAQAASPMVFGWRLCAWFRCRRAIGDGRGQSRRPPWCAGNEFRVLTEALKNSLPQYGTVLRIVRRRKKKGRVRTRDKLVLFFGFRTKRNEKRASIHIVLPFSPKKHSSH
jgi:hypothetical protein